MQVKIDNIDIKLDAFTIQYLATALWSSCDDSGEGEPFDANHGIEDFAPYSIKMAIHDCQKFQEDNSKMLNEFDLNNKGGHDFWLTRNGHGAGFWDGDYEEPAATLLTAACVDFGSCDLYIGDDGNIHMFDG